MHTAKQPASPPVLSRPVKMEGLHKYGKKIQFSNIHINDFFIAVKLDSLGSIHFSQSQSFTGRIISPSLVTFTLCYRQSLCFTVL